MLHVSRALYAISYIMSSSMMLVISKGCMSYAGWFSKEDLQIVKSTVLEHVQKLPGAVRWAHRNARSSSHAQLQVACLGSMTSPLNLPGGVTEQQRRFIMACSKTLKSGFPNTSFLTDTCHVHAQIRHRHGLLKCTASHEPSLTQISMFPLQARPAKQCCRIT